MYAINSIFCSTLSKLVRPLMVLSFNSPKPTKGLDALTISYRYDDGSTDRSKDDWESEDGVMVFSPGDDAMGFLSS